MTENKFILEEELIHEIIFKGGKDRKYPYSFNKKIPYFEAYMKKYSESSKGSIRNKLISFAVFLEENYQTDVLDADVDQILDFFRNDIDKRTILRETKNKWRSVLNKYYDYVKELVEKKTKKIYINPVPSINLFNFTEKEFSIEDLEKEEDLLNYEIVEKILNYVYYTNKRLFIIVGFLLYSGARISEICKIKLKEIDFEERFFYCKVKSSKALNKWGIYFFPRFFVPYIKDWIESIHIQDENPKYLFPSPLNPKHNIGAKTPRKKLRRVKEELGLKCRMNPHSFRDFINTERFDKDLNAKYRSMLLNQTPKGVNPRHYLKKYKKRKNLIKIYDETFPFPIFKPKPGFY